MKVIFLIAITVTVVQSVYHEPENEPLIDKWETFKIVFKKKYDVKTEKIRRKIWNQNLVNVRKHNNEYILGKQNYTLGINEFSDLTSDEFAKRYLSSELAQVKYELDKQVTTYQKVGGSDSVDWRGTALVNPVQNQGSCNCSYAFASVAALEGQYAKVKKYSSNLSKQQIIDCSTIYGNLACYGGSVSRTYAYLADYGSMLEEDYTYQGYHKSCSFDQSKVETKVKGFRYVATGRENDLANAVATLGPIVVVVDASQPSFRAYKSGIYDDPNCSSTSLNHAILVVGYGTEDTKFYWIAKNSWGSKWGNGGYVKIAKDVNNQCGIASSASIPLI